MTTPAVATQPAPSRLEWAVAVVVAVACAAVVMMTSSGLWFYADAWPMLAEGSLTSVDEWLRPHGGHWLVPARMGSKALFELVGMDFYPWFFLPRVALYGVLALGWWRVCRWRGVAPQLALGVLVLFSWLGLSGWIVTLVYIGPVVVNLCALVAAYLIERGRLGESEPDRRTAIMLAAALLIAAVSSASGPALIGAVTLVALAAPERRRHLLPIGVALAVYGTWYLVVARNDPSPLTPSAPSIGDVVRAPIGMADLIGSGLAGTFGLGDAWATPFAIALAVVGMVAFRAGWFNRFDAIMILTGLAIAALGVLVRGTQGIEVNAPNRLYLVSVYLLFGLAPALLAHVPDRGRALVTLGLLAVAALNLLVLLDEIDVREQARSNDRQLVETAAFAIAKGETYIPWNGPSPQAHHRNIRALVDQGWTGSNHPDHYEKVLTGMKVKLVGVDNAGGTPVSALNSKVDAQGCVALLPGKNHRFGVSGPGQVLLRVTASGLLSVRWQEGDLRVGLSVALDESVKSLAYAAPQGESATIVLAIPDDGDGEPIGGGTICGLEPGPAT